MALFCLVVATTFSAPLERDLGSGLVYFRIRALPADLPPAPGGRIPPCVIDVRYVEADAGAAAVFSTWMKGRAKPRSPVFVLANADTSRALREVLATHERGTGIVVLGIKRGEFKPDVAVKGSADDERRAYDALEKGAAIGTLLTDNPNKVRNDESTLSKDRVAEAVADAASDDKTPAPSIDATLQRAMHLHRALVALKKL
jgi:hypothetical protein